MVNNYKVVVVSDKKEWSVYLDIENMYEIDSSEMCCSCKMSVCDDRFKFTIVEMYDENGVDVARNSKVYRFAKEALKADGQPRPYCYDCAHVEEISFNS